MAKVHLLKFDIWGTFTEIDVDGLEDYYRELGCDCFDIATRQVDGKYFDIFVDDNGLLKDNPILTAINSEHEPMLVGNLIFANHDAEGNTTSLSEADIAHIKQNVQYGFYMDTRDTKAPLKPLAAVVCDY